MNQATPARITACIGRRTLPIIVALALSAGTTNVHSAFAADALTLPAPPFAVPLLPSVSNDWTVTIGFEGVMQPRFLGSKSLALGASPIFSIQGAGSPDRFKSALDNPSITLFDMGRFQAGVVGKFEPARTASSDKALKGLGDVGAAVEVGGFAEYFPVDWFRTRAEVRNGFGGHKGVVGELSADAIIPLTDRLTVSAGPRASIKNATAVAPYFDVDALQSQASGLPTYRTKGSTESAGLGAQLSYKLDSQWEVHSTVEYERLFGSAAGSPLVKERGSLNQLTFGIGLSYSFDVKVR